MEMEDMVLISTDDHLVEPADMFDDHTPAKYKGRYPRKERREDGVEVWRIEDREVFVPQGAWTDPIPGCETVAS